MQSPGPTPELGVGGGPGTLCLQPALFILHICSWGVEPPILQKVLGKREERSLSLLSDELGAIEGKGRGRKTPINFSIIHTAPKE